MNDQAATASTEADRKARQVEIIISNILRVGVIVSMLVVIFGTLVTFSNHLGYLSSKQDLKRLTGGSPEFPHSLEVVLEGLGHLRGRAIVVLGLLLLILTPVLRVATSIFAFVYERDFTFVVITSVVLALLILSFFLGAAGG